MDAGFSIFISNLLINSLYKLCSASKDSVPKMDCAFWTLTEMENQTIRYECKMHIILLNYVCNVICIYVSK